MWMHTCLAFFFVQNPLKHDVLTTGIVNEIPFVNDVALRFIELGGHVSVPNKSCGS